MQVIDYLIEFKDEFISLVNTDKEQKFLRNCFIKWYINSTKIGYQKLFPAKDIYSEENILDLDFANNKRYCGFDISTLLSKAMQIYNKYFEMCKDILYIDDEDTGLINQIRQMRGLYEFSDFDFHMNMWVPWEPKFNLLSPNQLSRLKWLYTLYMGNKNQVDCNNYQKSYKKKYEKLLKLYDFIDIESTTHLAMPKIINGVELFGSCVNSFSNEFCSLFEFEKEFGSLGSFWDYKFHKNGIYICNPPFNLSVIERMSKKLIADLDNTEFSVVIIQVLPIWDSESQKFIKAKDFDLEFAGYENLIASKYFREKKFLDKYQYRYWDHCKERYVSSSHTHLITLSNLPINKYKKITDVDSLAAKWHKMSNGSID